MDICQEDERLKQTRGAGDASSETHASDSGYGDAGRLDDTKAARPVWRAWGKPGSRDCRVGEHYELCVPNSVVLLAYLINSVSTDHLHLSSILQRAWSVGDAK